MVGRFASRESPLAEAPAGPGANCTRGNDVPELSAARAGREYPSSSAKASSKHKSQYEVSMLQVFVAASPAQACATYAKSMVARVKLEYRSFVQLPGIAHKNNTGRFPPDLLLVFRGEIREAMDKTTRPNGRGSSNRKRRTRGPHGHVVIVTFTNSAKVLFLGFPFKKVGEGAGSITGDIYIDAVNSPSLCFKLCAQMPGSRKQM